MITDAHTWYDLPGHGQQMTRCLYQLLNQVRDRAREEQAVILAGQARPLGELLRASPALAARFPAAIDFPGYTAGQLAANFTALAPEAGFTLTSAVARKVYVVLGQAKSHRPSGNARLAVRLLDLATASSQAHRIMRLPAPGPAILRSISPDDLPGQIHLDEPITCDERPGQYL